MKTITGALLFALVGFFWFKDAAGMMAPLKDKVILELLDGSIFEEELTPTEVEPKWMKPQNPHPIEERYSVYIQMLWDNNYTTSPFGVRHLLSGHNRAVALPKEAEAKFVTAKSCHNYEAKFFQPYNVSRPHPIPPYGKWLIENQGDGRIYVAIKGTQLVYWATFAWILQDPLGLVE